MSGQYEKRSMVGDHEGRPYEAPKLVRVSLKADEVLAYGCKTTGGQGNVSQANCGLLNNCVLDGS